MDLKNIYGTILFSAAVNTVKELVVDAVKAEADLREANLGGANLWGADLRGDNLWEANLGGADLRGADLREANLGGADLREANLWEADLWEANLWGADLRGANLWEANLGGADLGGADLREANLWEANLGGADLGGADLRGADLRGAKNIPAIAIAQLQHIPEEGAFVGFKKCRAGVIVKLLIPEDAKRSHGTERKCRASKAVVLDVFGAEVGVSLHDGKTEYRKGETVIPDGWSEDRWITCGQGIHFYITRAEAEAHQ